MTATAAVSQEIEITEKELVAAATSLVPLLRSRRAEADTLARMPDATVEDFEKARLFEMLVPKRYGGLQCSLSTFMDVVVELGRGDGSAAWVVALLSASTWSATTFYSQPVVDEIFSKGRIRSAGVLNSNQVKTKRVEGGVLIEEGIWHFNSGIHHAQWDTLGIPIVDDAGQMIDGGSALIPRSQITLLENWDTIGLRGTGSNSVSVKDVFVPNERIALMSNNLQENYGANQSEPLYRMPLIPFLATKLIFPALGMAKAALELFLAKSSQRGIAFTPYAKQDEAPVTHFQVAEASLKIDTAELLIRGNVHDLEAVAASGQRMTAEMRARIWRDAGAASKLIWEAVDMLAGASGASFAQTANPMNRLWRDVRVAGMHGGIYPVASMETYGRVLFGKDPKSPFIR